MKRTILAFVFAAAMLSAVAQTPPPAAGPQLTEVEKLKLENVQLKFTQLSQQMQEIQKTQMDLRNQYQSLVADIEKEHPGFTVGGNGELVAKPKPAEPKAVPKPEVKK